VAREVGADVVGGGAGGGVDRDRRVDVARQGLEARSDAREGSSACAAVGTPGFTRRRLARGVARLCRVTDELLRLARWLEAQPWNRPGTDKTWVLRCADAFREFAAARKRARAVAR